MKCGGLQDQKQIQHFFFKKWKQKDLVLLGEGGWKKILNLFYNGVMWDPPMQSIHPIEGNAFILDSHHNIASHRKRYKNKVEKIVEKRTVIQASLYVILLHQHRGHCRRSALPISRRGIPNAIQLGLKFCLAFAFFVL